VVPFVEQGLHLVQCSGKEIYHKADFQNRNGHSNGNYAGKSWLDYLDPKLYVGLVSALVQQPRFLSLTLAQDDAPSLLIDKNILWMFGNSIAGDTELDLVPIFLDLVDLPLESTGIVCGVAGKLVDEMRLRDTKEEEHGAELSYLSTARAGAVILGCEGSVKALEALEPLFQKVDT